MLRSLLVVLVSAAAFGGCNDAEITHMDCPGYGDAVTSDATPADTAAPDTTPVDTVIPDGAVAGGWVGLPCEDDTPCAPGVCLTQAMLAGSDLEGLDIGQGLCTKLFCTSDGSCGSDGVCDDTFGLCFAQCADTAECRWSEAYSCVKETADDATGACMPDAMKKAAVCEDGHCDEPLTSDWVGAPCEADADCGSSGQTCVTLALLQGMGLDIPGLEIEGGMCSSLMCATDESCGEGGICYDTSPFSGTPMNICLKTCRDLADCRWQEGYDCFRETPEDELGACLPDGLIVAIICDDGHCEEAAQ